MLTTMAGRLTGAVINTPPAAMIDKPIVLSVLKNLGVGAFTLSMIFMIFVFKCLTCVIVTVLSAWPLAT